jgi:nicotinamidase-related amidase
VTESLAETTWTNETALLVIDVQKGVVVDGFDRDGVVSRIAGLIGYARGHQVPVIYIQHEAPDYPPMARGGGDWEIVDEIAPNVGEPVIAKQYPDSFAETDLEATLDDLGVRHLVICGAQSDACVRATTYRAMIEGYDVTLVGDAHTTSDRPTQDGTIPAEQIISHVNMATPYIEYPGRAPRVVKQAELMAGEPVTI